MRLRHYSAEPFEFIRGKRNPVDRQKPAMKPDGFWVSDERTGGGWKWWCTRENWGTGGLAYEYEVKLTGKERILYLRTPEAIDAFTEKYAADSQVNQMMQEIDSTFGKEHPQILSLLPRIRRPSVYDIDWPRVVADGWQGIIITPYQWSRRLDMSCQWYYGWDCASGCIWDFDAIGAVRLKRTIKKYMGIKDPTFEESLLKMKASSEKLVASIRAKENPEPILKNLADGLDAANKEYDRSKEAV